MDLDDSNHRVLVAFCMGSICVPCDNSCFLIIGMFIEFAIEQATKGTKRPQRVGRVLARELSPRAVPSAPPVAQTYDVPENLIH